MKRIIFIIICILFLAVFFNVIDAKLGSVTCWNETDELGNIIMKCETEYWDEDTDCDINWEYFCWVCQEKGLKSKAYYEYSIRTLMGWETYWDEEGNYHDEDPNYTTSYFHCSLGHEWYEVDYGAGKTSLLRITKDTEDEPEKIIEIDSEDTLIRPMKELEKWKTKALDDDIMRHQADLEGTQDFLNIWFEDGKLFVETQDGIKWYVEMKRVVGDWFCPIDKMTD